MLLTKKLATKVSNSEKCIVHEYRIESDLISFCTAIINGRYPDSGRVSNSECEEIYFVTGGTGTIHSEFGDFNIAQGDLYHYKKGEKYWVEGDNLQLVLVNSPKWSPEQHQELPE